MKNDIIIGWIGTGKMGSSMAGHFINSGYICNIYNRTYSKAKPLIDKGARWCNNPEEVALKSDIVFTMVGYPEDVEEVYFGESGILKALRPNHICVDMTTTKPSLAIKIYELVKSMSADFIDAPVSGGDIGARNATLSIMVGGEENIYNKILPLLELLGKNIVYQGKVGSGQHTKMCNQIVIASTMIGVCESLLYARNAGLDSETMLKSITKGAAGCWSLDNLAPRIINKNYEPGFYVEHFIKDLGIAIEESTRMGLKLPGLELAKSLYDKVKNMGYGKKGTQALMLALEEISLIKQ